MVGLTDTRMAKLVKCDVRQTTVPGAPGTVELLTPSVDHPPLHHIESAQCIFQHTMHIAWLARTSREVCSHGRCEHTS